MSRNPRVGAVPWRLLPVFCAIFGTTGSLLFRDRLRRAVRYRGLMNDPIHAFYELGESLSNDIVSVVATRMRVETRSIFKK